jgi:hypothetical protein
MDMGFPDVCLTPTPAGPVPMPYPNQGQRPMAVGTALNVLISMLPAHNLMTTIPVTMGDQAGVNGGVASGIMMGPSRNLTGSVKVFHGGLPATRFMDPTLQNQSNCPGTTLVPSQFKVMILA